MHFLQRVIYSFLLVLLLAQFSLAVNPVVRRFTSYQDFLKGEADGIAVSTDGKLMLGPGYTTVLETGEPFIYSAAVTGEGTVYLGTGNGGKVFRVSGTDKKQLAELDEPGVYALAIDSSNRLYAGTSPVGKVYRINPDGNAEVFFDPGEKFIWDLAFDQNDNLYVATGTKGIVYKVDPAGEEEEVFDSQETHIVTLELDPEGNILAGSAPGGMLHRIPADGGKAFTLLDSELEEVKAVAVDRYGTIYAAALSGESRQTAIAEATATIAANAAGNNHQEEKVDKVETKAAGQLKVYRIEKTGLVRTLYSSPSEIAFDISVRSDGSLLLATGNKGRLIALDTEGFKTLLFDSEEEQITRIFQSGAELFAATSNLGKLIRLEQSPSEQGEYLSVVIDARSTSNWGMISWNVDNTNGAEGISFHTRSGNTKKPGDTWSEWSEAYSDPDGNKITSPAGRYLQWKLVYEPEARGPSLLADNNSIDSVFVTYQQFNLPPRINSLTVHSGGIAFARNQTSPPAGGTFPGGPEKAHSRSLPRNIRNLETPQAVAAARKVYIPAARSISWKASDPNRDDLVYSVYISGTDSADWQLLEENLTESQFTLDGASFADGEYRIRIQASDLPSNPRETALNDEITSAAFRITNRAPEISWDSEPGSGTIRFTVATSATRLFRVEYSVDSRNWLVLFPEDGITDSREESYQLSLPAGAGFLQVRAVDDNGNIGTAGRRTN